jgi:hypothetical protein
LYDASVISGTESWLDSSLIDDEIFSRDLTVYRKDRNGKGGGIFLAVQSVHNTINSEFCWISDVYECLCVEITNPNTSAVIYLVVAYRLPDNDFSILNYLYNKTSCYQFFSKIFIIGGVLNVPQIDWTGVSYIRGEAQLRVNELINEGSFSQIVSSPTRKDNIVYLFLIKPNNICDEVHITDGISDHIVVITPLLSITRKKVPRQVIRKIWNLKRL